VAVIISGMILHRTQWVSPISPSGHGIGRREVSTFRLRNEGMDGQRVSE
jgi:hypothetical protein